MKKDPLLFKLGVTLVNLNEIEADELKLAKEISINAIVDIIEDIDNIDRTLTYTELITKYIMKYCLKKHIYSTIDITNALITVLLKQPTDDEIREYLS